MAAIITAAIAINIIIAIFQIHTKFMIVRAPLDSLNVWRARVTQDN